MQSQQFQETSEEQQAMAEAQPPEDNQEEQEQAKAGQPDAKAEANAPQPEPKLLPNRRPDPQKKSSQQDKIAELEGKLMRLEARSQLDAAEVVDMEVATDLLIKGYTLEQLRQTKPYLFKQPQPSGQIKPVPRVVAPAVPPRQDTSEKDRSEAFVNTLAGMLKSKFKNPNNS